RLAVRPGADVGGDRHLADVELVPPHHAAERGDERVDLLEIESEGPRLDAAVLERPVVALGAGDGFELELGHGLACVVDAARGQGACGGKFDQAVFTPWSAPRRDA